MHVRTWYGFQLLNLSRMRCSHSAQVKLVFFSLCLATAMTARYILSGSLILADFVLCLFGHVNLSWIISGVRKEVRSLVG